MDERERLAEVLRRMIAAEASDLHIAPEQRVQVRCDGVLTPEELVPTAALMEQLTKRMMSEEQRALLSVCDVDFSWIYEGRRFRGNAYRMQDGVGIALRLLPARIPTPEEIGMPAGLRGLAAARDGLALICGATGVGKTTTLASLIEQINRTRSVHIITLEDPIEYVFPSACAFLSQREAGRDFAAFPDAVRSALREDPDLLLVGEIRDRATIEATLLAAATGVLVVGTIHAGTAAQAAWRVSFRRMRGMRCAHSLPMSSAASLLSAFCRGGAAAVLPRLRRWLVPPPCEMSCGRDAMISLRRS